jgi:hypothetical protein
MMKSILNLCPMSVSSGPFRGTKCLFTSSGDGVVAKLAGTYEMEIYPAFLKAIESKPHIVADIGAAEGFYVAGLARELPNARIIAYEAKTEWHGRISNIMEINGVPARCEIRGFCDRDAFRALINEVGSGRLFILMDIEGGEFELLTSDIIPLLFNTELLVELHEPDSRACGDALVAALSPSHEVNLYWSREGRTGGDVPRGFWKWATSLFPTVRQRLNERRVYKMRWLHAVPRPRSGALIA